MKSLTHKLTLVLLAMAIVPLFIGINAIYALRTAGASLNQNDRSLQNLTTLLNSAGEAITENADLQDNANRVAVKVNRAQEETAQALQSIGDSVLPKMFDIARIRFALGNVSMAERALLLALNMRHLDVSELKTIHEAQMRNMDEAFIMIEGAKQDYLKRLDSPTESLAWDEFDKALTAWMDNHDDFMEEIHNLDALVDDLVRGGPVFASASRKAYDTIFVGGREARELCEQRIEALNSTLSNSTAKSVESTASSQVRSNAMLRDLEKETAAAITRSNELGHSIDEARRTTTAAAADAADALNATTRRFRYLIFFSVAGILLVLVAGIAWARSITKPVKKAAQSLSLLAKGELLDDVPANLLKGKDEIGSLTRAVQELISSIRHEITVAAAVAEGDLTKPIPLRSSDDKLGLALQTMLENTNSALAKVSESVTRVNQGANQVTEASESLSNGAQTSAAALEEITQSVFHVDRQAKENAKNAHEASDLAIGSRESAKRGYDAVNDLVTAMAEIQTAGKHIASVAKLIDDIAFQTNLLALNAAVEAARAGRYGKGFTVVADEVRNLSGRSARAARETGQMVASMTERMAAGMELAEKSDVEFREIVDATSKVAQIFNSITAASNAQSLAVAQIAGGLEQIDEVIQENTHNAEATANSAQWLLDQANELRAGISRFKLTTNRSTPTLLARHAGDTEAWNQGNLLSLPKHSGLLPLPEEAESFDDENWGDYEKDDRGTDT